MSDSDQPLIARGKSLLDHLLKMAQTRLELVGIEIQEERLAIERTVRLAAITVICAWLAGVTLLLWIALVLPPEYRSIMLGSVFAALVIGAIVSGVALRRRAKREPLFSRVVQQLQLDRSTLNLNDEP